MGSIYGQWDGWVFSEGWGKVDKEWFSLRTARAVNVDGQEYTWLRVVLGFELQSSGSHLGFTSHCLCNFS